MLNPLFSLPENKGFFDKLKKTERRAALRFLYMEMELLIGP